MNTYIKNNFTAEDVPENWHLADDQGFSVLHRAVFNEDLPEVQRTTKLLLEIGQFDAILEYANGVNPLHIATMQKNLEIIRYLKQFIPSDRPSHEGSDGFG